MKKNLLIYFILLINIHLGWTQCGLGEDMTPPAFGNAGDGSIANPFKNLLQSTVGSVPSGTYYFNFNGSTFQGVLDNDTDGGGWLMVLNYVHIAGDNSDLIIRNTDLPLLGSSNVGDNEAGTTNWGHMGNALAAAIDFEEVRFYGETTGHNRIINFTTSYSNVLDYLKTGVGNFSGISSAINYATLPGHSANIPGQAFNVFSSQGDLALTEFPFWRSGSFHWGIRGLGNRWEVDDFAVNTQSTIHRVWVRGDLSPSGTTEITATLDNTGNVTINPTDFGLSVTDNCSDSTNINISLNQTDFTCTEIGANILQLTATDEQNNSISIDVTVNIVESPPIINTPPPAPFLQVELDSNGEVILDLATLNTTVTDDCGVASTTISKTNFNCTNLGFNSVTITATDINGNMSTASVFFNIVDSDAPVIQCVAPFSVELDATGSVTINPNDVLDSYIDNCEATASSISLDKSVFTCADIGDNLVTLTVEDRGGNETTCTTTITITVPSCPSNLTLESDLTNCGVTYNYPCASNIIAGPPSGTFLDVGTTTTFTYDTLDNTGGTVSCSYDVTVVDTQAPLFSTPDQTFSLGPDGTLTLTANDFLGPDPLARDYNLVQTGTVDRVDISTTGTEVILSESDVSGTLSLGFDFNFYGNTYDEFYISSKGFITFSSNSDDGCCGGGSLPNTSNPNNLIAFNWDDLNPEDGGTIRYETIGVAPNRILIVDFDNVAHYDDIQGTTVQLKLFETDHHIEIHTINSPNFGIEKTQGIENIDGTLGLVVPGRNAQEWSIANDFIAFIPKPAIIDGCGVDTLIASQTTFDCMDIGDVTITVTATDTNSNVSMHTATITITDPNGYCNELPLIAKVVLQGASLNPVMGEENLMRDDLRANGLLPLSSPYGDGAMIDNTLLNTTGNNAIVDWIWLEIREETNASNIVQGVSALLQRDGDVVSPTDGISPVIFNRLPTNYFIAVKHRSHLGIMTNTAINLMTDTPAIIDFTDASNQITFGTNAQTSFGMPAGKVGMWAGNVNGDTIIQYSGTTPDTPTILSTVLNDAGNFLNLPTYTLSGYNSEDLSMDGIIQYTGTTPDTPIILQNVLAHPGNFLNFSTYQIMEQLPEN
ncbi:hypothetical protein [Kordia sp.]|uniref:hypothetical protein n=1 Tax=Kordia sp. TaxID=1965332 RepID=UPI003B5A4045